MPWLLPGNELKPPGNPGRERSLTSARRQCVRRATLLSPGPSPSSHQHHVPGHCTCHLRFLVPICTVEVLEGAPRLGSGSGSDASVPWHRDTLRALPLSCALWTGAGPRAAHLLVYVSAGFVFYLSFPQRACELHEHPMSLGILLLPPVLTPNQTFLPPPQKPLLPEKLFPPSLHLSSPEV